MALVINTNLSSLNAQNNLTKSSSSLSTSIQRLSTGLRINSAKDDAAGLGIVDRMTSQIRGLNQAARNANDAISLSQTAEGAMNETSNILQRMRELAIQSANDTNSSADRANLQKEMTQLTAEVSRIASTTTFNGNNILDGSFAAQKFQVGSNANETVSVSIGNLSATALGAYQANSLANIGTTGDLVAVVDAGVNVVATDTISIAGSAAADVTIGVNASAAEIALSINGVQGDTGVTATASTSFDIQFDASQVVGSSITFNLSTEDGVAGATQGSVAAVTHVVTSTTDYSALRDDINAFSASTGVTASLNTDSGNSLTLTNSDGHNIELGQVTSSTGANADVFAVGNTETTFAADDTLTNDTVTTNTNTVVVGGQVTMTSTAAFSATGLLASFSATTEVSAALSSVATVDISTQAGSNAALTVLDQGLRTVSDNRSDLGAIQNRLGFTISNLASVSENVSGARSQIQDTDFAMETANLTRNQILQQAGIAMLSQANSAPQAVLSLLQ